MAARINCRQGSPAVRPDCGSDISLLPDDSRDAVDVLGLEGGLTAEQAAAIRQALKLDDPWLVQFGDWLSAGEPRRLGTVASFRPIRIGHAP